MSPLNRPTLLPFSKCPTSRQSARHPRPRGEEVSADLTDYFFLPYVLSLFVALLYSAFVAVSTFCTSEQTARTAGCGENLPERKP